MRILIVSDAWYPQVNGVVRTLDTVRGELVALGHRVEMISPDRFRTVKCPTYPEIRLAFRPGRGIARSIARFEPQAIHIATEGPLGWAARRLCKRRGLAFTTSFHTKFPEYIHARFGVPVAWGYAVLRRFHDASRAVMVATPTLARALEAAGFANVTPWSRGVDTGLFRPRERGFLDGPRPIALFVGRVAVEKNVEAFLKLELKGTKYVVGDGPQMAGLKARYPAVRFTGYKTGEDLARHVADADVFVFPSRTDTYGLVLLEALASGVPVAAYPVHGPIDVVNGHRIGALDEDLGTAVRRALKISRQDCRDFALDFTWRACAEQFLGNLHPIERAG